MKVLIEGEEEVGGESIAEYVRKEKAKLKADFALVCDTEMFAPDLPTLCVGLRGLVYTEIEAIWLQDGFALWNVRRCCSESILCADRDHQQTERCQRKNPDPWLLQQGESSDQR